HAEPAPLLPFVDEEPGSVTIPELDERAVGSRTVAEPVAVAAAEQNPTPELFSSLFPESQNENVLNALTLNRSNLFSILTRAWNWLQGKLKSHQERKRLRVCETVSLGEKRFVAVIQVDGEQFLVGGSASSVSTLARLEPRPEFSDVFRTRCEEGVAQA